MTDSMADGCRLPLKNFKITTFRPKAAHRSRKAHESRVGTPRARGVSLVVPNPAVGVHGCRMFLGQGSELNPFEPTPAIRCAVHRPLPAALHLARGGSLREAPVQRVTRETLWQHQGTYLATTRHLCCPSLVLTHLLCFCLSCSSETEQATTSTQKLCSAQNPPPHIWHSRPIGQVCRQRLAPVAPAGATCAAVGPTCGRVFGCTASCHVGWRVALCSTLWASCSSG